MNKPYFVIDLKPGASRDINIDMARTFAILIMLSANAWPYLFKFNQLNFGLRVLFSCAAPIFAFLLGYTYALNVNIQNGNQKSIKKVLQIIFLAFSIDAFIWGIIPFMTYDVLYILSLSLLLLIGLKNINRNALWILLLGLIGLHFLFFSWFDYRFEVDEYKFKTPFEYWDTSMIKDHTLVRFVFDGWFPFLPWFSITLLGFLLYHIKFSKRSLSWLLVLATSFLIIGIYLLSTQINYTDRNGYYELFYPFSINFYVFAFGLLMLVFLFLKTDISFNYNNLLLPGKYSLFVYLVHATVIGLLQRNIEFYSIYSAIITLIALYSIVYCLLFLFDRYKSKIYQSKIGRYLFFLGL